MMHSFTQHMYNEIGLFHFILISQEWSHRGLKRDFRVINSEFDKIFALRFNIFEVHPKAFHDLLCFE